MWRVCVCFGNGRREMRKYGLSSSFGFLSKNVGEISHQHIQIRHHVFLAKQVFAQMRDSAQMDCL